MDERNYYGTAKEITELKMKRVNGDTLTYEEIGKILGCARGSVKFIEVRAIKKLRAILDEKGLTFQDLLPSTDRSYNVAQEYKPWKSDSTETSWR